MAHTREQKLSLAKDRPQCVTANAGSGKTRVLVDKYIDILLNGIDGRKVIPNELVAITFTRKAASEMLAKVTKEFNKLLQNEQDPKKIGKLKIIRENLINANISTIHSFAGKILRDFPIEAGVAPNFTEISDYEKRIILQDAILSVIEDWLDDQYKKVKFYNLF